MRILSITAQKASSTGSGVYLTELVKGFAKMGCQQAIIAGSYPEDVVDFPVGVSYYPVYFGGDDLNFPIAGMSDEMPYKSTRYSDMTDDMTERFTSVFRKRVLQVVEEFRPDVILCHHLYYLASMVREVCPDIRVYGISHGSDIRQIKKNPWQREYIMTQIKGLDGILALHQEQKAEICQYYSYDPNKVMVIGTGYNSDVFYVRDHRKETEKLRLIFAGKISEKKGVMSLLRAMKYIPDCKEKIELCLVGGHGNQEEYDRILRLAEQCPCKVVFTGRLQQSELAAELNKSDIFVLPSFYEGLPLVIIEAMACGLAVVCSDLPGVKAWVDANIPNNQVVFVKPPKMRNEDEPEVEELPDFEERLAKGIIRAEASTPVEEQVMRKISWDGLCHHILAGWNL